MIVVSFPGERLRLYTLAECSRIVPISTRTWRSYIQQRRIPAQKLNHKWYISETNLRAFLSGARSTHDRFIVPAPVFEHEEYPPDPWEG